MLTALGQESYILSFEAKVRVKMTDEKKSSLPIKYKRASDFKLIPATGAFGGPNPNGEIICNFFIEYRSFPENLSVVVEDGKVPMQVESGKDDATYIRELQAGIVMRPDIARLIGEWLVREANKALGGDISTSTKH
jgi:hypothetical protein